MIIDGKKIAEKILDNVKSAVSVMEVKPVLAILMAESDLASERFVAQKEKVASQIGVETKITRLKSATTRELIDRIEKYNKDTKVTGIVVQLPLPEQVDVEKVLDAVSCQKDVDVLSEESVKLFRAGASNILPPVVGAVKVVLEAQCVDVSLKKILVIGRGRLVGKPVVVWFKLEGADVAVADRDTENLSEMTREAEIIVSGAGRPGLLQRDMLSDGVMLIDAGMGKRWGKLAGDANPACAEKCSIFTPMPGGIGIITVAKLFKNVVQKATTSTHTVTN